MYKTGNVARNTLQFAEFLSIKHKGCILVLMKLNSLIASKNDASLLRSRISRL